MFVRVPVEYRRQFRRPAATTGPPVFFFRKYASSLIRPGGERTNYGFPGRTMSFTYHPRGPVRARPSRRAESF